ncbi:hypothetical protein, partial [uncultured Cetobacterium sp.]|uniref:hypothetical protein n=1 Tax=uncultured Cetobacterium sp. TaxID=527638 RepID=UPI00262824B4
MKSIIVILYMIFSTVHIFAENKIPHELILENPKAKITTIETKKEKEKSCLNLTVTKINSKNIDLDVNEENKIISCNLDVNKVTTEKNDSIFFVKNINEIPTMTTINGVSHLNRLRNQSLFRATGVVNEDELTYNSKPILNNKNKKVINIEYKNQPKDLYMAIVNSKGEIKSVFKGNLKDKLLVDPAENKTINLQVWLFAGEINNNRNIVFSWANNLTGDIAIKPSDSSINLDNINLQRGLNTVFNLSEAPIKMEFQGTDKIIGENIKNIGAITPLNDNFYTEGKEGVKFSSKNYDYTAYIYNNFSGVVINLTKKGKIVPEIESFNLVQKNSKGELIQNIKITFYINSGTLKDHIPPTNVTFSSDGISDFWGENGKTPINRRIY